MPRPRTYQLHLNSKFRDSGTTGDWAVNLPHGLLRISDSALVSVTVNSIVMRYDFYTVNSSNNAFSYDATPLVLPDGSYTVYTFLDHLNATLPDTTVTYDNVTNKYNFLDTSGGGHTLSFPATSSASSLFGFDSSPQSVPASGTLTSANMVHMGSLEQLYLLGEVPNDHVIVLTEHGVKHSNVLASIPVVAPPFSNIVYHNPNDGHDGVEVHGRDLNHIAFRLVDQDFRPVMPSSDWVITLNVRVR